MATFSYFPLQVHGKFYEYGGKHLQLDQWAPPFCSHWPTTSPPLIFSMWFGNGIEVHPVWESLSWCKFHQTSHTFHHKCISVLGKLHQTIDIVRCKCILVFGKFHQTCHTFHCKCISVFGKCQYISVFQFVGNFIRLFTFFVLSVFRSLGNFIRLVTLFIISVFRSLGNFIRLVTLFVISLNFSQFM